MTKLEAVQMIGDVLTELDVTIGSLLPSDVNHRKLLDLRILLDDRQQTLSKEVFDENTPAFQNASQRLSDVNVAIEGTLQDLAHLNTVIQNVTRFLDAATSLISTLVAPALRAVG